MTLSLATAAPADLWSSADLPGLTRRQAGHLFRRAAFGPSLADLDAAVKDGPGKTIDRLLAGGPGLDEFDARMASVASTLSRVNDGKGIRSLALTRMYYSPHPLREKMALFLHDHFATSNAKVQSAAMMLGQADLLRKYALGGFADLLRDMSRDPAMLVWLDGKGSRKGSPNENYGRELMELFSLGIGPYTEADIREAARAFTGWDVVRGKAAFDESRFDAGTKTVMGKTGAWKPDDIVRICLERPECGTFVARKVVRFLVSDTWTPTAKQLAPLAASFAKGHDLGALVATVLRSNAFWSSDAYRAKVKSPVEFALGIAKGLEGRIGTSALADVLEQLGQSVFYPPSVKGWDGGTAWINGQTLLYRHNLALAMTSTEDGRFGSRTDPAALAERHGRKSAREAGELFVDVFLQGELPAESSAALWTYAEAKASGARAAYRTERDEREDRVRSLCRLVLTMPEFQLS